MPFNPQSDYRGGQYLYAGLSDMGAGLAGGIEAAAAEQKRQADEDKKRARIGKGLDTLLEETQGIDPNKLSQLSLEQKDSMFRAGVMKTEAKRQAVQDMFASKVHDDQMANALRTFNLQEKEFQATKDYRNLMQNNSIAERLMRAQEVAQELDLKNRQLGQQSEQFMLTRGEGQVHFGQNLMGEPYAVKVGPGGFKVYREQTPESLSQVEDAPADVRQRVAGRTYRNPSGATAVWSGGGWKPVGSAKAAPKPAAATPTIEDTGEDLPEALRVRKQSEDSDARGTAAYNVKAKIAEQQRIMDESVKNPMRPTAYVAGTGYSVKLPDQPMYPSANDAVQAYRAAAAEKKRLEGILAGLNK